MKQTVIYLLCFLLLVFVHVGFLNGEIWTLRQEIRQTAAPSVVLPPPVLKMVALEHSGLLANAHLLKLMTFYGGRYMNAQALDESDWRYVERLINSVIALDPKFADAYLMGEGLFLYDANNVDAAIRLMEKGRQNRPEDWRMTFYLGANYLLGKNDYRNAAKYFMESSEIPGSPSFLPTLAARLGHYSGETKVSILFLKGLLEQTSDPVLKGKMQKRLSALEGAMVLENAIREFKEREARDPDSMDELVRRGILENVPKDPYGGKWTLSPEGRVYSTSRFAEAE